MRPNDVGEVFREFFNSYYTKLSEARRSGGLQLGWNTSMLFPTILLLTETSSHHVVELLGASRDFFGLELRTHREQSVSRYISQLSGDSAQAHVHVDTGYLSFQGGCIGDMTDLRVIADRFPAARFYADRYRLMRSDGNGAIVSFGPNVKFCSFIDTLFVHRSGIAHRVKHVLYMAVLSKSLSKESVLAHLNSVFESRGSVIGVHFCQRNRAAERIIAGQLQSMFMQPNLRETTIGEFIRTHPDILLRAFSGTSLIYEPYMPWQVPVPTNSEQALNPDMFLERADGFYDVIDLKTAALRKVDLTKGPRKRRRFIDYVSEGIAQLAHYREYLSRVENLKYVEQKYGAKFDHPRFTLIVGHYENADRSRVAEAQRMIHDIDIVDYDTVIQLYLSASGS